jgi:TRAP transporter TAXI family solute receptor
MTLVLGDLDFAFAYTDIAYAAYTGELTDGETTSIRGVAALQIAPIHLVVGRNTGARTVRDLAGLRVGIGQRISSTELEAERLFEAYGVDRSHMQLESLPFDQATDRFLEGALDAFFVNESYPSESVRRALSHGAILLSLERTVPERLLSTSTFLSPTVVPLN